MNRTFGSGKANGMLGMDICLKVKRKIFNAHGIVVKRENSFTGLQLINGELDLWNETKNETGLQTNIKHCIIFLAQIHHFQSNDRVMPVFFSFCHHSIANDVYF